MKKGLLTTLTVAITFACLGSAFAMAPTIRDIPDVLIGDAEDNVGTDNNYFVFTNAFQFDNYASDGDTTVSDLLWTFDEHSVENLPDEQWFAINGQAPVHVGDTAMAADSPTPTAEHQNPSSNELRGVSAYASFRDIVFSPGTSAPPPAFPSPSVADAGNHAAGKVIRFYVSDGTNVASKELVVSSIDEGFDGLSGGTPFVVAQDDNFTTDASNFTPGGTTGWVPLDPINQTGKVTDYDAANTGYRVTISSGSSIRINGWQTANSEWMPYAMVGTDNVARGKFYIFRNGQANTSDLNQVPNTRFRLSQRFAVTALLEVFNHAPTEGTAVQQLCWELGPSTDPNNPSIYRVDLDPIDVPQMDAIVNPPYPEGISRAFEAYSLEPQENGSIELTESVIGYYPKTEVDPGFASKTKTYTTSASDAGDLKVLNSTTEGAFLQLWVLLGAGGQLGNQITPLPATGIPTYNESSLGLTFDSTAVATDRFGLVVREFAENLGVESDRFRVAPDKQYMYRFHVTSTTNSATNPELRMRAYSVKFYWAQKLVVGGSLAAGNSNNTIAAQALPGNGCLNPDKDGSEAGGYYNLIIHTPMSTDIQTNQPFLAAQPGPGDPQLVLSRRDLKFGMDLQDTISGSPSYVNEAGNYRLDKVSVYEFDLVPD